MTMSVEPIEDEYLKWLCAKILDRSHSYNVNYRDLMKILQAEEFHWTVNGDHNRADDGKELRGDFIREADIDPDEEPNWFDGPCSVLEMMVAFSVKAEFQTDLPSKQWFWKFMENLNLHEYRHISDHRELLAIEEILYQFINRTYRADGQGGMFPMRSPRRDQRKEEIWHQFFDYLEEQGI